MNKIFLLLISGLISACSSTTKSSTIYDYAPEETVACQENKELCDKYPDLFKPDASSNCEDEE